MPMRGSVKSKNIIEIYTLKKYILLKYILIYTLKFEIKTILKNKIEILIKRNGKISKIGLSIINQFLGLFL